MGEEDYAVRAAREWFVLYSKYALNLQEESTAIEKLAAIIRKHVQEDAAEYHFERDATVDGDR